MTVYNLEHEQEIKENFENNQSIFTNFNKEVALKTVLFSMLFYIINNPLVYKYLSKYHFILSTDINLFATLIFGVLYYIISYNI